MFSITAICGGADRGGKGEGVKKPKRVVERPCFGFKIAWQI